MTVRKVDIMFSVFKWTVWQRRWSMFWWSFGVAAFIFINMIFYPSFKDQAAEMEKSFGSLSESTVAFIGGSTDFFSPVGFLNSQIFFIMLPLLLGILAISLGSSLLARDEQDGTIELLLARPISRTKLLLGKMLAIVGIVVLVAVIGFIITAVAAKIVGIDVSVVYIATATLVCFLMSLCFGLISFLLTSLGRARAASMAVGSFVALGGYIVSSLAATVTWLEWISRIFPFHYYHPEDVLVGNFEESAVLIFATISVICCVLSVLFFRKRDLY